MRMADWDQSIDSAVFHFAKGTTITLSAPDPTDRAALYFTGCVPFGAHPCLGGRAPMKFGVSKRNSRPLRRDGTQLPRTIQFRRTSRWYLPPIPHGLEDIFNWLAHKLTYASEASGRTISLPWRSANSSTAGGNPPSTTRAKHAPIDANRSRLSVIMPSRPAPAPTPSPCFGYACSSKSRCPLKPSAPLPRPPPRNARTPGHATRGAPLQRHRQG